ncbi:unnamed protein product [Pleuronectes platessa]|uniref:Uncharacterized protein n=1 Tax=Pleuronectes platessa TaxID=8262 RepID=A0A9N7TP62_PLEPL|nr:unnamed protein product [Pleuronectes platessa]
MTTVLSVTTPPIVWPKKRASVATGTIIKEQEWTVHIKQHNGVHRPTCMAAMKGGRQTEREAGVKTEWEGVSSSLSLSLSMLRGVNSRGVGVGGSTMVHGYRMCLCGYAALISVYTVAAPLQCEVISSLKRDREASEHPSPHRAHSLSSVAKTIRRKERGMKGGGGGGWKEGTERGEGRGDCAGSRGSLLSVPPSVTRVSRGEQAGAGLTVQEVLEG